ncbi:hypothetical protein [Tenacibaculum maritimum]|uniref:hypothetical protein n=1 Tax=Tenacibaculum maritimum TaxID=107401 RepID=UPI0003F621ED|nr:hypothetical protein [Tenacibaculum maritimum]
MKKISTFSKSSLTGAIGGVFSKVIGNAVQGLKGILKSWCSSSSSWAFRRSDVCSYGR